MPTEPATKTCPYCAETILAAAIKCKHCHEMLDETPKAAPGPANPLWQDPNAVADHYTAQQMAKKHQNIAERLDSLSPDLDTERDTPEEREHDTIRRLAALFPHNTGFDSGFEGEADADFDAEAKAQANKKKTTQTIVFVAILILSMAAIYAEYRPSSSGPAPIADCYSAQECVAKARAAQRTINYRIASYETQLKYYRKACYYDKTFDVSCSQVQEILTKGLPLARELAR